MAKVVRTAFQSFKFWMLTIITACLVWLRMQLKHTSILFKAVDELVKYIGVTLSMNHGLVLQTAHFKHPKPSANGSRRMSLVRKPKHRR